MTQLNLNTSGPSYFPLVRRMSSRTLLHYISAVRLNDVIVCAVLNESLGWRFVRNFLSGRRSGISCAPWGCLPTRRMRIVCLVGCLPSGITCVMAQLS